MNSPLRTIALAALLLAAACSRPSESTDAKRSPKPPPSASVAVPASLHIDVEVDGTPVAPIDAARLEGVKPDFNDDDHRAWRLATLVGPAAARPGVVIAAVADQGVSLELRPTGAATDPTPVLELNRRGEVVVTMMSPGEPFPEFHGKGGRLNRPGDPAPRVMSPTKLRVSVAGASAAASSTVGTGTNGGAGKGGGESASGNAQPLKVVITGGTPTTWTPDAFAPVKRFTIHSDGSEKDAWSLRDIAHQLVGPKARVLGAVDGGGTKARIAGKDWADAKKTPVLRINRRGMYKIEWVDKDGNMTNDDDVRDVKTIEVSPGG
ncbi:MAG TPA: hypothetical protein VIF09_02520 [Polyangiaceae bacterium]|jgi:hypothetical protein